MIIKAFGIPLATLLITLAGCTDPAPTSTPDPVPSPTTSGYQVPTGIHFAEHWVPTPAVDLMSSDGTFIRAFAESSTLQNFNGPLEPGMLDADARLYPGFRRADRTGRSPLGWFDAVYGYKVQWVLSFEETPGNAAKAVVCSFGSINPTNEDAPSIMGLTLRYHRTGTPPPANQRGPARAPAISVFGDWYATDFGSEGEHSDMPCVDSQPNTINKSHQSTPGWPESGV